MEIINKELKCLDKGYVKLIDFMGTDSSIVEAARISTNQSSKGKESDQSLINYLMRNGHTSPFEMAELKFEIKLPIFLARQWVRHRTANINEISARYTELPNEFWVPEFEDLKTQSTLNHQGGSEQIDYSKFYDIMNLFDESYDNFYNYEKLLEIGVSREVARTVLPVSIYTKWIWKNDLHNTLKFLKLRLNEHAQPQIRVYAEAMAEIIKELFPMTWEAFEEFELYSIKLSKTEVDILRKSVHNSSLEALIELYSEKLGKSQRVEFEKNFILEK